MPNTLTSPNMTIVVPVALTDPGPDWASRLQTALYNVVDAHDHSSTKGVPITPAGLNINADLPFAGTNATGLRSVRLAQQGAPLAVGTDVGCLYDSAGELWYNDGSARQVQLTQTGAVKSAPQALSLKSVTTSYTILSTDPYQLFTCQTGSGAVAIALPSSALVAPGRTYFFSDIAENAGVNAITITPNGADTIAGYNGAVTVTTPGAMVLMTTDGAGRWSLNVMATCAPAMSLSIAALTTGNVTLTTPQLLTSCLRFSGTLTGAVVIIFPNAAFRYECDFSQVVMGAFTIAVKSGSTTSATMAAANIGSTQTLNQMSLVVSYGGNTIRLKA